jgi:hypothetical protein
MQVHGMGETNGIWIGWYRIYQGLGGLSLRRLKISIGAARFSPIMHESGAIRVRDHANDVLIAVCASRVGAELITANREDMQRWRRVLNRSRRKLRLQVVEDASY